MPESIERNCARIFRDVVGLAHPVPVACWDDARLLGAPLESLEVDSLALLDFIMRVETTYDVELDEDAVNACQTIGELASLVATTKQ